MTTSDIAPDQVFRAVEADQPSLVAQLLESKAPADDPNKDGVSPLYQACTMGRPRLIELLIHANAQVEGNLRCDQTPLHAACLNGCTAAVKILLENKADVNAMTKSGVCALYMAAERGHVAIINLLLDAKADVDLPSADEITPLMRAAYNNQLEAARTLVGRGASMKREALHKNAAEWAKQAGHVAMFEFLQNKQAPQRDVNMASASASASASSQPSIQLPSASSEVTILPEVQQVFHQFNLGDDVLQHLQELTNGDLNAWISEDTSFDPIFEKLKFNLNLGKKFQLKSELKKLRSRVKYDESGSAPQVQVPLIYLTIHVDKLKACCQLGECLVSPESPAIQRMYQSGRNVNIDGVRLYCRNLAQLIESQFKSDFIPKYSPQSVGRVPVVESRSLDVSGPTIGDGSGSQARVVVVNWQSPGLDEPQEFVFKQPHKSNSEARKAVEQEAQVWRLVPPHPNVAHMAAIVRGPMGSFEGMLMLYHSMGSLDRMKVFRFHERDLLPSLRGLARGLMHIHTIGLVHRDIATRNVLASTNKEFILSDFGMSQFGGEMPGDRDERLPWRSLAPEILQGRRLGVRFSPSTDIWAFGVLLWEIANTREAYSELGITDIKLIQNGIEDGSIELPLLETCLAYPPLTPALLGCLQRDPSKRPNARELVVLLGDNIEEAVADQCEYAKAHYSKSYTLASTSTTTTTSTTTSTTTITSITTSTTTSTTTATSSTTTTATSTTTTTATSTTTTTTTTSASTGSKPSTNDENQHANNDGQDEVKQQADGEISQHQTYISQAAERTLRSVAPSSKANSKTNSDKLKE